MRATIYAGMVIGLLLIGISLMALTLLGRELYQRGGELPAFAEKGMSWGTAALLTLLAVGLAIGGVFLIRYVRSLSSHRVCIFSGGFLYSFAREADAVPWGKVEVIKEIITYERLPIVKGPAKYLVPKEASFRYVIVSRGGKEYTFDGDSIQRIKRFGKVLRQQATEQGIQWVTEEQG